MNIISYVPKGTSWVWLNWGAWDGKVILDYSEWMQCNNKDTYKTENQDGQSLRRRCNDNSEKKKGHMTRLAERDWHAGFESGGRGHKPKNADAISKVGNEFSLRISDRIQAYWHLDFRTSDLWNYKIINLCCLSHLICSNILQGL